MFGLKGPKKEDGPEKEKKPSISLKGMSKEDKKAHRERVKAEKKEEREKKLSKYKKQKKNDQYKESKLK